jgi:hypothetical protein
MLVPERMSTIILAKTAIVGITSRPVFALLVPEHSSLTLDPPPVVANGEFSFAGSGGVSITGNIVSPNSASGFINLGSCVFSPYWRAEKK